MVQADMTPEQFEAKKTQFQTEHGITITGNIGSFDSNGYVGNYDYDGKTFTINLTHTPMFRPKSLVEAEIRSWLHA